MKPQKILLIRHGESKCNFLNPILSVFIILFSVLYNGYSQDIHFSQFYSSPLLLNPAQCGLTENDNYRAVLNYKQQWSSISTPYKTYTGSFDTRILPQKMQGLTTGILFFSDRSGTSRYGISQANVNIGYISRLNENNLLSAALSNGIASHSIELQSMKWGNQFNGNFYDIALPNGETDFYTKSKTYFDLSGGLQWKYSTDSIKAEMGISCYHANTPNISLFSKDDVVKRKFIIHGSVDFNLKNSSVSFLPKFFYSRQGNSAELNFGTLLHYEPARVRKTGNASSAAGIGIFYRTGDAVILVLKFDILKNISAGFSYDINTSGLSAVTNGKGGFEAVISYTGTFARKRDNNSVKL